MRLAGGNWNGEGRVEIFHNGSWGTVCDDLWDINVAVSAPQSARFGSGHGQIWLDNVRCQGQESATVNCQHAGWGVENCGYSEDASAICSSKYNHHYICIAVYSTVTMLIYPQGIPYPKMYDCGISNTNLQSKGPFLFNCYLL